MKGGQAQGPVVKSVHIPLLSEGIQTDPGLLGWKGGLITKSLLKSIVLGDNFNIQSLKDQMTLVPEDGLLSLCSFIYLLLSFYRIGVSIVVIDFSIHKRH